MEVAFNIIEIKWEGPFSVDELYKFKERKDYGLYQIYGAHAVHGPDTLLYIGKANESTFSDRFKFHETWITISETKPVEIYIGRLGSADKIPEKQWGHMIDVAEALSLYFANPVYNKRDELVKGIKEMYIVFNYSNCNRLPLVMSNYWYEKSSVWSSGEWQAFEFKNKKSKKRK